MSKPAEPVYVSTKAELAEVFGVNQQSVTRWSNAGAPKREPQGYRLRDWLAWWVDDRGYRNQHDDVSAAEADRRWKLARAERQERKNAVESGQVIPKAEANTDRMSIVTWAVGIFERAGSELTPKLAGKLTGKRLGQVKAIVDDYFRQVRERVAGNGKV